MWLVVGSTVLEGLQRYVPITVGSEPWLKEWTRDVRVARVEILERWNAKTLFACCSEDTTIIVNVEQAKPFHEV